MTEVACRGDGTRAALLIGNQGYGNTMQALVNPQRDTGAPAIEMGDIRKMYVICQAFQGDLLKLRPGLRAKIKSSAFAIPLKGVVENVGRLVDTKAQLGDVRIRLDDPRLASRVVGMEVEVEIAR